MLLQCSSLITCTAASMCGVILVNCLNIIFTLAASSGKRNLTVWRPSVRPSHLFLTLIERATRILNARRQHATRPAYIFVRVLRGQTYLYLISISRCRQKKKQSLLQQHRTITCGNTAPNYAVDVDCRNSSSFF